MPYKVIDVFDSGSSLEQRYVYLYESIVEAVDNYNKFVDVGDAKKFRTVALVDKDGEVLVRKELHRDNLGM